MTKLSQDHLVENGQLKKEVEEKEMVADLSKKELRILETRQKYLK